jgi:hypothetical protein
MLLSQRERTFDEGVMKAWHRLNKILPRLKELSPDLFDENTTPAPVGVSVVIGMTSDNYSEGYKLWGFDEPVGVNADSYLLRYTDEETNSIDVSALILGAKEGSFVVHKNLLAPAEFFYRKTHFHKKTKKTYKNSDLFLLNGDLVRMRNLLKMVEKRGSFGGTGIQFSHATHDGKRTSFDLDTELDKMVQYYQDLKKKVSDYKQVTT